METLEIYDMPSWSVVSKLSSSPDSKTFEAINNSSKRKVILKVSSIPTAAELAFIRETMDEAEAEKCLEYMVGEKKREFALQDEFVLDDYIVNLELHDIRKKSEGFGYDLIVRSEMLISLEKLISRKNQDGQGFNMEEIVKLGLDICKALVTLHRKNVMHRDIKPSKIFLDTDGNYKLGDFSTAVRVGKEVADHLLVGSLEYMAPEVLNRGNYDFTVDLYSLGIVLKNLLGEWSTLPAEMQTILWKSTSSKENRFLDANDMLKHLAIFSATLKSNVTLSDSSGSRRIGIIAKETDKNPIVGVRDATELLGDNPYKTINENSIFFKFKKTEPEAK
ncbi:MAG: protein kinase [Clostridiales bacterium]|nr:protein kinase [Clostridiales bacterium]